jgi:hypothetical protein
MSVTTAIFTVCAGAALPPVAPRTSASAVSEAASVAANALLPLTRPPCLRTKDPCQDDEDANPDWDAEL